MNLGKPARVAIIALGISALSACKTHISSELYTSDVVAATRAKPVHAPMTLEMEVANKDECREMAPVIVAELSRWLEAVKFTGCYEKGFNDFARFAADIPVYAYKTMPPKPEEPFAIGVTAS